MAIRDAMRELAATNKAAAEAYRQIIKGRTILEAAAATNHTPAQVSEIVRAMEVKANAYEKAYLGQQNAAKDLLLEGKTIMNWNDADTSAGRQFVMPVADVLDECAHALRVLDPATYGAARIAGASSITGCLPK